VTVLCITPTRSSVFDISISHGIAPDGLWWVNDVMEVDEFI
jgi:hypothetical protein